MVESPNERPVFSVIMNCRNSAQFLKEAIDSVYAQSFKSWEIVFFDNASTDESARIAQSYDSKVRYHFNAEAVPLGEARNRALALAQGQYLSFLDCDDIWFPELLEQQEAAFRKFPTASLVHSNYFELYQQSGGLRLVDPKQKDASGDLFRGQLERYQIGILTVSIRKTALAAVGEWFDSRLTLAEDFDLFMRLLLAAPGVYLGKPLAKYRVHAANLTRILRTNWAEELRLCYDKFATLVPDFDQVYGPAARRFKAKIAYLEARNFVLQGKLGLAKTALRPYRTDSLPLFGCYLLAHFPPAVWTAVYKSYFRLRYRQQFTG